MNTQGEALKGSENARKGSQTSADREDLLVSVDENHSRRPGLLGPPSFCRERHHPALYGHQVAVDAGRVLQRVIGQDRLGQHRLAVLEVAGRRAEPCGGEVYHKERHCLSEERQ